MSFQYRNGLNIFLPRRFPKRNINALPGVIKIFYRREKEKQSFRTEIQEYKLSAPTLCPPGLCGKLLPHKISKIFHHKNGGHLCNLRMPNSGALDLP